MNNNNFDSRDEMRRSFFMEHIPDFAAQRGLEIGALCFPTITKDESDIMYYDIASKEELMAEFADSYPGKNFVDVDFVSYTKSMHETLGKNKFDYVIANHVIEHIPDFIGFFNIMHKHLNENGKVFLAVPDRRFTFDVDRPETSAGHMIVDFESNGTVDSAEHILDSLIYHSEKLNIYWPDIEKQRYNFIHHHHVFNYENFLDRIIRPLMRMRYFNFSVTAYRYTPEQDNEFYIILQKSRYDQNVHILGETVPRQPPLTESATNEFDYRTQMYEIIQSTLFRTAWYLETYPQVKESGVDPLKHYFFWGAWHGYNPSEYFDSTYYLDNNADVRNAGFNPLWHYVHKGISEGRKPKA